MASMGVISYPPFVGYREFIPSLLMLIKSEAVFKGAIALDQLCANWAANGHATPRRSPMP